MIEWVTGGVLVALAVVAGLPAILRAVSLARYASHRFETHGAANDAQFWPARRRDEPVERVRARERAAAGMRGLESSLSHGPGARG